MSVIDNPFDGEAERRMNVLGCTEDLAKNVVIYRYLLAGDTRALAHWLCEGLALAPDVQVLLSAMLQPERQSADDPGIMIPISKSEVPYMLRAVHRDGRKGRPTDLVAQERNRAIEDLYQKLLAEIGPGGFESAVAEISDILKPHLGDESVREALKKRSKMGSGKAAGGKK